MKYAIKPVLFFSILLLMVPICFGINMEKQIPSQIDEPAVIEITVTFQTEGERSMNFVELFPLGTELIEWESDAPVELDIEEKNWNYFGNVIAYMWDFEEITQDEIIITYKLEIEEYGEFQSTTLLVYKDNFVKRDYVVQVGEVTEESRLEQILPDESEGIPWYIIIIIISSILVAIGVYYKYFMNKNKSTKKTKTKK